MLKRKSPRPSPQPRAPSREPRAPSLPSPVPRASPLASRPEGKKGTVPFCAKHPSGRSGKRGPSPFCSPLGFTLIELLVTITIIGMLAAMMLGALHAAGNAGKVAATKATIAKLNTIIMQRYESYMTRRVPITITGLSPSQAAEVRLGAIRDLMRMEMPDRWEDVTDDVSFLTSVFIPVHHRPAYTDLISGKPVPYSQPVPEPALHQLYRNRYGPGGNVTAGIPNMNSNSGKILYMLVSMGSPEAMEQFNQSEIKADTDGWSYFVDGWGQEIRFLRWAPGVSSCTDPDFIKATGIQWTGFSDIQPGVAQGYPKFNPPGSNTPLLDASGNPVGGRADHDPFDTRNVDLAGFRLVPLIYSFGRAGTPNLNWFSTLGPIQFYDANIGTIPMSICGLWSNNSKSPYQTMGAPSSATSGMPAISRTIISSSGNMRFSAAHIVRREGARKAESGKRKSGQWPVVSGQSCARVPAPRAPRPWFPVRFPLSAFRFPRRPSSPAPRPSSPAFTLIEMLVVVAIMMVLVAAAATRMRPASEARRIRESARALNVYLGSARNRAMETGRPCGVILHRFISGTPLARSQRRP